MDSKPQVLYANEVLTVLPIFIAFHSGNFVRYEGFGAPEGQPFGGAARTSGRTRDLKCDLGDDLALEGSARAGKHHDAHSGAAGGCALIRALTRAVCRAPVPRGGAVLRVADGRIAVGRGCERRHARASLHRHETDLPVRACAGQRGCVENAKAI